jgi:rRNA maturation endonuclease Nob1
MHMSQPLSFRPRPETERMLSEMETHYNVEPSGLLQMAVAELYRKMKKEIANMKAVTKLVCTNCGKIFDNGDAELADYPLCADCKASGRTQDEMAERWQQVEPSAGCGEASPSG